MLRDFINRYLDEDGDRGNILHIGAGLCEELPVFTQLGFAHILLVEANPELARKLSAITEKQDNVEVREIVIAGEDERMAFYPSSNPRFDSLKKPTTLGEFYPNLKVLPEFTASAQSLNSLLRQYPLDATKNNLLVLEVQGAELDILQETDKDFLQQFTWIAIKTSSLPLYEHAAQSDNLVHDLETMGFELRAREEINFPFCLHLYQRSDAKKRLWELKIEIEESKKTLSDVLKSLNMNSKLLVKAQADNESLRKKYSEKVNSEKEMVELVRRLRDRLQAAADFYRRLEKDHPDIIREQDKIIADSEDD